MGKGVSVSDLIPSAPGKISKGQVVGSVLQGLFESG